MKILPEQALMIAVTNHRLADGTPSFSWPQPERSESVTDILCLAVAHLLALTDRKL